MKRIVIKLFVFTLLIVLMMERVAFAYIDPSTGGMLFQMLATSLALLSGIALVFSRQIRVVFARIVRSLRRMLGRDSLRAQDTHAQSERAEGQQGR